MSLGFQKQTVARPQPNLQQNLKLNLSVNNGTIKEGGEKHLTSKGEFLKKDAIWDYNGENAEANTSRRKIVMPLK